MEEVLETGIVAEVLEGEILAQEEEMIPGAEVLIIDLVEEIDLVIEAEDISFKINFH